MRKDGKLNGPFGAVVPWKSTRVEKAGGRRTRGEGGRGLAQEERTGLGAVSAIVGSAEEVWTGTYTVMHGGFAELGREAGADSKRRKRRGREKLKRSVGPPAEPPQSLSHRAPPAGHRPVPWRLD